MTSQQKDKYICENFDPPICWHEIIETKIVPELDSEGYAVAREYYTCKCGKTDRYKHLNPDFESEAGRVQLLKLIPINDVKKLFLTLPTLRSWWENLYLFMTNDKGLFRDEVFRWMGGVE